MRVPTHNFLRKVKNYTQICLFMTHLFGLFGGMVFTLALDRNLF